MGVKGERRCIKTGITEFGVREIVVSKHWVALGRES